MDVLRTERLLRVTPRILIVVERHMTAKSVQGGHFQDHMKFPDFSSSLDR